MDHERLPAVADAKTVGAIVEDDERDERDERVAPGCRFVIFNARNPRLTTDNVGAVGIVWFVPTVIGVFGVPNVLDLDDTLGDAVFDDPTNTRCDLRPDVGLMFFIDLSNRIIFAFEW